ncbi:protein SET DOMAIN group 41 [Dorcoceras hygrometricum]|uniref:Protein SET DOMAIN group 41 n=1 Tax=Dorcoceras hygrometricum TaxID=472368 RepID=A0A2Z7DFZ7_9LAMI|nr:protein SET DOMAIN group 41 [Dorcoceras hygrometricum]
MEMKAVEDIAMVGDLTPPIPPLAFALHDSALNSHCSACFTPLPAVPFPPLLPRKPRNVPNRRPTVLYCSSLCSSLDSPLHFSSAEPHLLYLFSHSPLPAWGGSSDLRLSLRLLHTFQKSNLFPLKGGISSGARRLMKIGGKKDDPLEENKNFKVPDEKLENQAAQCGVTEISSQRDCGLERIAGLMTNRERLVFGEFENYPFPESMLERIREGTKAIAAARMMLAREEEVCVESLPEYHMEELVLCLVLTNAVEVQDRSGHSIGVAVYGTSFSWINHSCSPNACYRFLIGSEDKNCVCLRISPAATNNRCGNELEDGTILGGGVGYGPRVVVRSIKAIEKGEEVTIAYTDLLQPKVEMRQEELWLKYLFCCCCKRCSVPHSTYVDRALQMVSATNHCRSNMISDHELYKDEEIKKLMETFDEAIGIYLSFNDPERCCEKLETLLTYGDIEEENLKPEEEKLLEKPKLHLFHHLSIDAYTTLTSAYKVRASDLLSVDSHAIEHGLQGFDMYKTSAAYSLLVAGVSDHLFMFESSLVASVANFWTAAGESLLSLSGLKWWDSSLKTDPVKLDIKSLFSTECSHCSLSGISEPSSKNSQDHTIWFQETKMLLLNCIASLTSDVWSTLSSQSSFLKLIPNPTDFSWLESIEYLKVSRFESHVSGARADEIQSSLILLAIHCLMYGELLTSICYGFAP